MLSIQSIESYSPLTCTDASSSILECQDDSFLSTLIEKISSIFSTSPTQALQKCNDLDHHFLNSNPSYYICSPDTPGCLIDPCSASILQKAIRKGMNDCASLLIEKQWGLSYKDPAGNSPLHYAVVMGNNQILTDLLKNKDELAIDETNDAGHTALHLATEGGHTAVVAKLLEHNGDANHKGPYLVGSTKLAFATPLQLAVIHGYQEVLDVYLEAKGQSTQPFNPNLANLDLELPEIGNLIHLAIYFNQYGMLEHLLNRYWDLFASQIGAENDQGETPLMLAARLGNIRAIQLLQRKNVNLEQSNKAGERAIHFAAKAKQGAAIDLLNYYGVELSVPDKNDVEPKDYLIQHEVKRDSQGRSISVRQNHPLFERLKYYRAQKREMGEVPMTVNWLSHPPENLVFEGGGPKGIAYMGALNVLEENGFLGELKRVGGTSAGAIQAAMMSVGYLSEEMIAVFNSIDPREFMDHPTLRFWNRGYMSEAYEGVSAALEALCCMPGLADGNVLREWLDEKIAMKAAQSLGKSKEDLRYLTFGELRKEFIDKGIPGFRHLYVNAIRISDGKPVAINSEDPKWDHIIISDAIRASASVPGIFKPHALHALPSIFKLGTFDAKIRKELRREAPKFGYFVDGGLIKNNPIDLFDSKKYLSTANLGPGDDRVPNPRTLCLSNYWAEEQIPANLPLETMGELSSVITNIYSGAEKQHLEKDPFNTLRTINIDNLGIALYEFGADPLPLLQSGAKAASHAIDSFTGEINEGVRYALEASGIKLPHLYPAAIRQFADNLESLHNKLLKDPQLSRKAILWSEGPEKRELAVSFRNRYAEKFSRTLWITPKNEFSIYKILAESLKIKFEDVPLDELRVQVHAALEFRKEKKPYLLIYEDFKDKPSLSQGENGRFIILTNQKPSGEDVRDALQPPILTNEEKEYLSTHYFQEIFESLRNPNCEEKSACWDLDERQLENHPMEKEVIEAIYSKNWLTPSFKESQECLRLRADDPRPDVSLFFSTRHTMPGDPLSPKAYLEDQGDLKGLFTLNRETDLKYKSSVRSYKDICREIHNASNLKTKRIRSIYIQANEHLLLSDAERHGYSVPDKSKPFSECYSSTYTFEKANPTWIE